MRRSLVLTGVGARTPFAGEPGGVTPIINPASTSASMAEKAALRVALDAPLSRTARWTASMITAKPWSGIVTVDRSSFIGLDPPTYADQPPYDAPLGGRFLLQPSVPPARAAAGTEACIEIVAAAGALSVCFSTLSTRMRATLRAISS